MVFTSCSIASSNFISAAVLDISTKAAVKERADCMIDCINVHKMNGSPATSFTSDVYVSCTVETMRLRLVHRLTMYSRTIVCRYNPGLYYHL